MFAIMFHPATGARVVTCDARRFRRLHSIEDNALPRALSAVAATVLVLSVLHVSAAVFTAVAVAAVLACHGMRRAGARSADLVRLVAPVEDMVGVDASVTDPKLVWEAAGLMAERRALAGAPCSESAALRRDELLVQARQVFVR